MTAQFLLDFTEQNQCWELHTWEVVEQVVKTKTMQDQCRYVELGEVRASGAVGAADVFISHAWGGYWRDLVCAAVRAAHGAAEMRFWVDCLAILQHAGEASTKEAQAQDLQRLGDIVRLSQAVLLVANPGGELGRTDTIDIVEGKVTLEAAVRRTVPFFRIWCLFELHTAASMGTPVVMMIGAGSQDAGRYHPAGWDTCRNLMYLVNSEKAEASVEADRERILREVRASPGGVVAMDSAIRGMVLGALESADQPLVQACACGSPQALQELARAAAEAGDGGWGLLQAAASGGYERVLRALHQAGVEVATLAGKVRCGCLALHLREMFCL